MALFRRRSTPDEQALDDPRADEAASEEVDAAEGLSPEDQSEPGRDEEPTPPRDRAGGPFDQAESDLADASLPRLDLGSLLIPGMPDLQVQVEADPNTQQVRAVTAVAGDRAVQVQAFAAPRSEGIWDEIRAEMLAELSATTGAQVSEQEGPFGPELRAVVPARTPEGTQVMQPLRFAGIDGPRWFLRAVFLGRAAVEPDPEDVVHMLVRQIIVVRGGEAMAPRDPLPLRLPEQSPGEAIDTADDDAEGDEEGDEERRYADLDPFERGPEITEIR